MSNVVIKFEDVTKRYESHIHKSAGLKNYLLNIHKRKIVQEQSTILNHLNFHINKGESVGFVGRNGAGKSTLLSLIAQVMRPNEGRITVNGRVSSLLELGAGFHPDLTGVENIELYGVVLGFSRRQIINRTEAIIEYSELKEHIDVPIRYYSSGMLARLGFSVIAHLDPEILLIDEVLAVGDHSFQNKCKSTMEEFRKSGKTLILVSHSAPDIENLCDRAIWIENGVIEMSGEPKEILDKYHERLG